MRRAELGRIGELVVRKIDGDDLARAGEPRAEHDAKPHAAQANHRDRLARLDFRGVDHRANPGQHRAAEQSGELERQVRVDLDTGFARHHCMGGEGRDAEKVVDRLGLERKAPLAGEQRSRGVGLGGRLAERRPAADAGAAAPAARDKHQHDMIAGFEVAHAFADVLDDSRRLVAERHRDGPRPRAVDHRKVRMAEAGAGDLDQRLAAARGAKVELHDFERLRLRVGRGEAGLAENGSLDAHGVWVSDPEEPLAPRMRPRHIRRQARLSPERAGPARSRLMPQTQSKFFDDLSRLMTDAAGLADGARREAQTFARAQMERMMAGMNIPSREEFEAVKEMAAKARDENEKLAARVAALEARLNEPRP